MLEAGLTQGRGLGQRQRLGDRLPGAGPPLQQGRPAPCQERLRYEHRDPLHVLAGAPEHLVSGPEQQGHSGFGTHRRAVEPLLAAAEQRQPEHHSGLLGSLQFHPAPAADVQHLQGAGAAEAVVGLEALVWIQQVAAVMAECAARGRFPLREIAGGQDLRQARSPQAVMGGWAGTRRPSWGGSVHDPPGLWRPLGADPAPQAPAPAVGTGHPQQGQRPRNLRLHGAHVAQAVGGAGVAERPRSEAGKFAKLRRRLIVPSSESGCCTVLMAAAKLRL